MDAKIITCHYAYNYGAVLQTYALCDYLNDQGVNTEVINYRPYYYQGSTKCKNKLRLLIRKIVRIPDNIKSEKIFYGFLKEHVPMTAEYKDYEALSVANIRADIFVAGSDQIWNFNLPNGLEPAFYLDFAKDYQLIVSYAASLSTEKLTDKQILFLRAKLQKFNFISVRESTGKKLLDSAGIKNVQIVADPVYLLDPKQWEEMEMCPQYKPKGKYILVYAFNRQKNIFQAAKELARKEGYMVYSVNTFWEDYFQGMDHYYWNCRPEEFLYLIRHAELVATNSFHGLSFALLFNRPVALYEKDDSGNSRMTDLLDCLKIKSDVCIKKEECLSIKTLPWDRINEEIEKFRYVSKQYLERCIGAIH